jgi:hypothetical protein
MQLSARRRIVLGAVLVIIGLLISVLTYDAATLAGGRYVIAWGPVAYGFIELVRGFTHLMTKPPSPASPSDTSLDSTPPATESLGAESPAAGEADWWDLTCEWIARHGALPVLGVITLVVALVHARMFAGELAGDDLTFHFAESARLADCLRVGDFDFWNPSANAGYASAYYYQALPQLASALPTALFGNHLFWFQLSVFLPLVLAPAAAYRGLRLIGATPWQATAGAFVVAFMNGESKWGGGNAGTFIVGLYTQTWALAAAPLALGYGARWISENRGIAPAIAWGAFVGLCHPFAIIVVGLGLAVSVLTRLVPRLDRLTWQSVAGRALLMLGVALIWVVPNRYFDIALGLPALAAWLAWLVRRREPQWQVWVGFGLSTTLLVAFWLFGPRAWIVEDVPAIAAWSTSAAIAATGALLVFVAPPSEARWVLPDLRAFHGELARTLILGGAIVIAWSAVWVPLVFDYGGFGGFPHRVGGEEGPGFFELARWYRLGFLLDFAPTARLAAFTWFLPIAVLFARDRLLRWLWPPALFYALLLGLGPHLGKIGDDLFPAVRTLGAMQVVLALGIGATAVTLGRTLWQVRDGTWQARATWIGLIVAVATLGSLGVWVLWRDLDRSRWWGGHVVMVASIKPLLLGVTAAVVALVLLKGRDREGRRTSLLAIAGAIAVLVMIQGAQALGDRVRVLGSESTLHRDELLEINDMLAQQPPGRKQVGPGAENHWWNLLSYVYARIPATLQMGGGGLQASPNYDFMWTNHSFVKMAWIYDAPYLVFEKKSADKMPIGETIGQTEHYELRKLRSPGLVSPVQVLAPLPPGYRNKDAGHVMALEWYTGHPTYETKRWLAQFDVTLDGDEPMHDRVLAYAGSEGLRSAPDGKMLRAWHQDSPGDDADIVAEVEAKAPTTFAIRESWHPRWRVYIDGDEARVRRVTPDFPAVDVPAGKHTLELRFERPWWAQLAWFLWPLTAVGSWLLERWSRRRTSQNGPNGATPSG